MEHLYIVLYNSHCVNISDNNYSAIKNNFKIRNFGGLRNEKYINYLKFTQKKRKLSDTLRTIPKRSWNISAQMKTFIDRTYPIWQHLGKKEIYYIVSAGLGVDIIERSLGDLDGFVDHFEEYNIAGKLYATNVMDAGMVLESDVFKEAYEMGYAL